MLFFGETNGLIKGSSIEVLVSVPVLAGEHAGEHVGEDWNKDFGEDLVELLMC